MQTISFWWSFIFKRANWELKNKILPLDQFTRIKFSNVKFMHNYSHGKLGTIFILWIVGNK